MLQQILRDMYVDPDLLAELDEEQKQILFCKMREEQVRRWKDREEKLEREDKEGKSCVKLKKKAGDRKVGFAVGKDGEPWTWVMGEHDSDKSIEELLEEEAQLKARNLAEKEASATLQKLHEEVDLANKLQSQSVTDNEKEKVVEQLWKQNIIWSQSADQSKRLSSQPEPQKSLNRASQVTQPEPQKSLSQTLQTTQAEQQKPDTNVVSRRKSNPTTVFSCVMSVKEKRSSEIFASLQMNRQKSIEEAEKQTQKIHSFWMEQEKKAKQEEEKQRLLAQKAREDHRRSMRKLKTESQIIGTLMVGGLTTGFALSASKPVPGTRGPKGRPSRPSCKEDVIKWYREIELPKNAGIDPKTKKLADYFHGTISRDRAESLLKGRPTGSFLVRLSDKIWGYGLSCKSEGDQVKHYLIDATDNGYQFFGTNQIVFKTLAEFITHYQNKSICLMERQLLQYSCPQDTKERKDCEDLIKQSNSDGEVSYL